MEAVPLAPGKQMTSPAALAELCFGLIRRLIVIRPGGGQMVMASIFFIVSIPRQCHPTNNWEQQADASRSQT
jgi:hypothetical protein